MPGVTILPFSSGLRRRRPTEAVGGRGERRGGWQGRKGREGRKAWEAWEACALSDKPDEDRHPALPAGGLGAARRRRGARACAAPTACSGAHARGGGRRAACLPPSLLALALDLEPLARRPRTLRGYCGGGLTPGGWLRLRVWLRLSPKSTLRLRLRLRELRRWLRLRRQRERLREWLREGLRERLRAGLRMRLSRCPRRPPGSWHRLAPRPLAPALHLGRPLSSSGRGD